MYLMKEKPSEYIRLIEEDPSLVQVTNSDGFTIFHYAALYGRLQVMETINNIDPHMKDRASKNNRTPLMFASMNNQAAFSIWLLDHDVDVNIKNDDGETAIDFTSSQEIKKMIKKK